MSSNIQAAIDAAKAAAANVPSEASAAMGGAMTLGGGTALGAPAQRGAPLAIDDMLSGSLDVVAWLKVNEYGLFIGADNTPFDEIDVIINMNEVSYCYSVRYGNPAVYEKTYDRVTNAKGGSWADTLAKAQRIDNNASEFRSADIPFYVVDTIKNKKGEVLVEAGKAIGHSLSVTGWKAFQKFAREAAGLGHDLHNGTIRVKLGCDVQKNQKGTWGILKFSDIAPAAVN